jgi:hypothetical protein
MSDDIRVRLTWSEVLIAANVGVMRNVQCLRGNLEPSASMGLDNTWTPNIEGAAGEMAVAKHFGRYWNGNIGDLKADDVGPLQVRTNTSRRLDDLILRPKDRDDRVYISVLSFLPEFVLCGWITGIDGKREEWLREGSLGRPPCYFVPRDALESLADLPKEIALLFARRDVA